MESRKKGNKTSGKQKIFENDASKSLFNKGLKYIALALPLLFFSPVLITMGFKALNKSHNYWVLILGCLLTVFTIILVIQGFRVILKALFAK